MARIEDYALIGDCETAALVGRGGSIDWLCLPRFDSDACFASLLGAPGNGRWLLAPKQFVSSSRRYRAGTLILETTFELEKGRVRLIDFMPPKRGSSKLIRIIECLDGNAEIETELIVRFDNGDTVPWVTRADDRSLTFVGGPHMLLLATEAPLRGQDMKTIGSFSMTKGQRITFALSYHVSFMPPTDKGGDPDDLLQSTEAFWRSWSGRCTAPGPYSEPVARSLITLKALTFGPSGGVVAAPTTSLPEQLGGSRNWDYRFCWIRDATLTLVSLMRSGYYDEAVAWRDWLLRAVAGSPDQLQIMYGVTGERHLPEREIPWLGGYEDSRPVRIGNAAHTQLQLDVFGELMDALYEARRGGLSENERAWDIQCVLLDHLEKIWRNPDQGIWEARSPPKHYTYSKVMCWVAFDRSIKSASEHGMKGPVERWKSIRSAIHDDICLKGFDQKRKTFVQAYGGTQLDATLLRLPLVGFLSPDDPRVRSTVEAVEAELVVDGLVRRYDTSASDDGVPGGEGLFLACSFWLAEAYALIGRHADAKALFERLLKLRNDVGLLSEEYAPDTQRLVGNFPQAFSHIALVNSAHRLAGAAGFDDRAKSTGTSIRSHGHSH